MKYLKQNGIHIIEVPVDEFKILMVDSKKKEVYSSNYANAGYFASYRENGSYFTLPVGHLVCDMQTNNQYVKKYCSERGNIDNTKFQFDSHNCRQDKQFYQKKVSTLLIKQGDAWISDIGDLPKDLDYAIAGIPVMRNGADVKFKTYVVGQGWDSSPLYGTWHTFIGLKNDKRTIYVMGMKTTSTNMILSAEAYKKFKALGFVDVLKLDGGGSFYMNVNGKQIASTLENRRINTIIAFGPRNTNQFSKNPYHVPTAAITRLSRDKEGIKWLQWQLCAHGYTCDIDGSFGSNTYKKVIAFQKDHGLDPDGCVGPATRSALLLI